MNNINKNKVITTCLEFNKQFVLNREYNYLIPKEQRQDIFISLHFNDEIVFDSRQEYEYFKILVEREKQGLITNLELKPVFVLCEEFTHLITGEKVKRIVYKPDFAYVNKETGRLTIVEYKGFAKSDYMLRKNWFLSIYRDVDYKVITYTNKDLGFVEVKKGHSIKLLKRRNRKAKAHKVEMDYRKYNRLKGKTKPFTPKEREFILYFNEKYKNKLLKRDTIML